MYLPPEAVLQAFFLSSACVILVVDAIPALRARFLAYGPRAVPVSAPSAAAAARSGKWSALLDGLASLQVPHSWFAHFYVVSVAASTFWALQWLCHGRTLSFLSSASVRADESVRHRMSSGQVFLTWLLMSLQGGRRLFESTIMTKPSTAQMWFVHWLLGIGFYLAMSVAIWIEGDPSSHQSDAGVSSDFPYIRTTVGVVGFVAASWIQCVCHAYLRSLRKYTLPIHTYFRSLLCPHYTAECAIYLSLSVLAAPVGQWLNVTIFTAFVFVVVNLGVTAETSREWYARKFGADKIEGRWRMIPLIF